MLEWTAIYNDGSILNQYNEDKTENKYVDIDRTRLSEFRLQRPKEGGLVFSLFLEDGQRLIYRKRTEMTMGGSAFAFYMVGWQMNINGKNIQSIAYVYESGSPVFMAGQFRDDHPLFYSIVPTEEEL